MPKLTYEELTDQGFIFGGECMPNGELRVRCMHDSGVGYIWTQPPQDMQPTWQNAHYHKGVKETYIVQKGQMAFATRLSDGDCTVQLYGAGAVVTSQPGVEHNVYLFAGCAIHTVKHGVPLGNPDKGGADWYPSSESFDTWCKSLSEADMRHLSGSLG